MSEQISDPRQCMVQTKRMVTLKGGFTPEASQLRGDNHGLDGSSCYGMVSRTLFSGRWLSAPQTTCHLPEHIVCSYLMLGKGDLLLWRCAPHLYP